MDNRIPVPFEDITDPEDLHCAEFLAFTQHVQWNKTGQKVFVTDFQGMATNLFFRYIRIFILSRR